ncbi:E3 ubiquitin-protein ligase HRD1 [Halotydeus destructor]|nr:E3 ubiquitin-protein ligase HRD1 [Halotydeus destructor]
MVNVGSIFSAMPLVAGVVAVAFFVYQEYKSYSERQQSYSSGPSGQNRSQGSSTRCPPQPDNDCIICKDSFFPPLEILPCGHIYHRTCIREWFLLRLICPMCKSPLTGTQKAEYEKRLDL